MKLMDNKIDFAVILTAKNTNPNGDPLNENRPRENYDGLGEISDVCIKRKIRNRWQDMGKAIFVQSDDRSDDGCKSLKERADKDQKLKDLLKKDKDGAAKRACDLWLDVRAFGNLFAYSSGKKSKKGENEEKGVSVAVRGPVSLHPAFSVDPIEIETLQITKSVNAETSDKGGRSSDTMGMKHRVKFGVYVFYGSINCQLAERTGFSFEDAELLYEALKTLFENDSSSARPDGSMEVRRVYWWQHNCKSGQYPSAAVHRSVQIESKVKDPKNFDDYSIKNTPLEGLEPKIYEV